MKFLIVLFLLLASHAYGEVTHTDVEQALKTVTTNTRYPDQYRITRIGMEDPVGVIWNHKREICEVLVSAKHLSIIELMFNNQPKMPMLEGFIAHELSHCVELKELDDIGGYSEMRKLLMNPDTTI